MSPSQLPACVTFGFETVEGKLWGVTLLHMVVYAQGIRGKSGVWGRPWKENVNGVNRFDPEVIRSAYL